MFSGKYIVNEALTLHKIHKYSVGFLNQDVVKSKICHMPQQCVENRCERSAPTKEMEEPCKNLPCLALHMEKGSHSHNSQIVGPLHMAKIYIHRLEVTGESGLLIS